MRNNHTSPDHFIHLHINKRIKRGKPRRIKIIGPVNNCLCSFIVLYQIFL
jgi:hypothetical protein